MVQSHDLKRINQYVYEIPRTYRGDMRVAARFYADPVLLEAVLGDKSLDQLVNTATLPGVTNYALAMPDIHEGYGFPIGGVVATRWPDGVISPGGVGYDINCGVRLLATRLQLAEISPYLGDLATVLYRNCPSGVGKGGSIQLKPGELDKIMETGARWTLKRGYATEADLAHTEENGCIEGVDQVGTLGAGNHFIEVDVVDEICDEEAAQQIGLFPGQVVAQIHCGSRGFGHQICTDYVHRFQPIVHQYGIELPDRELVCAPLNSPEGQNYLAAMKAAANYAFVNRQVLTYHIRSSFDEVLAGRVSSHQIYQIYDIAHNMAKIEEHEVDGRRMKVCVHRKGATRAFGPGSAVLPDDYRQIGQPVLVPGSMGTASWVLLGTAGSMAQTFGSTCHGAGRALSRTRAKKMVQGSELRRELEAAGIHIRAGSMSGLAEEAPMAYKDVDHVIEVVHGAGIAKKLARLRPVVVIKG